VIDGVSGGSGFNDCAIFLALVIVRRFFVLSCLERFRDDPAVPGRLMLATCSHEHLLLLGTKRKRSWHDSHRNVLQLGCAIIVLGSYDGFECHLLAVVTVMTLELSLIVELS
jgi:hypothetical protein